MPSVCWASGRGYQFSPSSVHFKGEISDALPRKRHQKRQLEFCTAYLLSRGSGVRVSPGAPLHFFSTTCARSDHLLFRQMDITDADTGLIEGGHGSQVNELYLHT